MVNNDIYLNCGIYQDGGNPILFIAVPGYFASTAWCKSDEAYNAVMGSKFEGITSDNNKHYLLDRGVIRRITEDDDIDELLNNANKEFIKTFNEKFNYESI